MGEMNYPQKTYHDTPPKSSGMLSELENVLQTYRELIERLEAVLMPVTRFGPEVDPDGSVEAAPINRLHAIILILEQNNSKLERVIRSVDL